MCGYAFSEVQRDIRELIELDSCIRNLQCFAVQPRRPEHPPSKLFLYEPRVRGYNPQLFIS